MKELIDLTGQVFGSLRVIQHISPKEHGFTGRTFWLCECACGRRLMVRSDNLRDGKSSQCSDCRHHAGHLSRFLDGGEDDGQPVYS